MGKYIDLTGMRFGRLTVLGQGERGNKNTIRWKCKCVCGKETLVFTQHLKSGHTHSCGCEKTDRIRCLHGTPIPRLTRTYHGMIERCYYTKHVAYKYYGGRGIRVCDEWMAPKTGREAFIKWAISNGYDVNAKQGRCTIDRIDIDGDYSPENCRIVNQCIQSTNKRHPLGNNPSRGIRYDKATGKYIARISVYKKRLHLGCFNTVEEAIAARREAELKHYGQTFK